MGTVFYESDYALLTFYKQNNLLLLVWKSNSPSSEYKEVFIKSIGVATSNKVLYFVSDIRKEGAVSVENLRWLKEIVIPKAIDLGIKKIALVLNEGLFSKIYADTIQMALDKSRIKINYFFKQEEAIDWVKIE